MALKRVGFGKIGQAGRYPWIVCRQPFLADRECFPEQIHCFRILRLVKKRLREVVLVKGNVRVILTASALPVSQRPSKMALCLGQLVTIKVDLAQVITNCRKLCSVW